MKREEMIAAIDQEIVRLERIRELLTHSRSDRFLLPPVEPTPGKSVQKRGKRQVARPRVAQKRRRPQQNKQARVTPGAK